MKKMLVFPLFLLAGLIADAAQFPVTILSPHDMQRVPYRPCLVGTVHHHDQSLFLVVHPTLWSDYYVQPAVSWVEKDRFRVTLYVGEQGQNSARDEVFEVQVFEDPKNLYHEGMKLGSFPASGTVSPIVRVVRDDKAPDGCDEAAGAISPSASVASSTIAIPTTLPNALSPSAVVAQTHAPSVKPAEELGQMSLFASEARRHLQMALFVFLSNALLMMIALVRLNDKAANAAEHIGGSIIAFFSWLRNLVVALVESVGCLGAWLGPRAWRAVVTVFKAHGYDGNLRSWGLSMLVFPVLLIASVMVFYAEARMTQIGLGLIFTTEDSSINAAKSGSIFDSLVSPDTDSNKSAKPEAPQPQHLTLTHRVPKIVDRTFDSFQKLWDEPLGFMAMGLASLQFAFGIAVLWGTHVSEAARLRSASLFRQRPLLCTLFILLTIALAAMAAMRGYQLSPTGSNAWAPAIIAGSISFALAPIMAFCAHYAIECAGDQFAVLELVTLAISVGLGMLAVVFGWVVIALAIFLILAAAFLGYALPATVIWIYFQSAKLYGDFITDWKSAHSGFRPFAAQAISIVLFFVTLLVSGYLLTKGMRL